MPPPALPPSRLAPSPSVGWAACLLLAFGTTACQGREARRTSGLDEPATSLPTVLVGDGAGTVPREGTPPGLPIVEVEPGPYADDERFASLASASPGAVRAAADRLELTTGLAFRDRAPPRVVFTALRTEWPVYTIEPEVGGGRRRARIDVNARALVGGRTTLDRVLLHAFADAALRSPTSGPTSGRDAPPWFVVFAGHFVAGDAGDEVERLARERERGAPALRIDPTDPAHAGATGLAVALLVAERSTPVDVRRLLALVADGDDAERLVRRTLGDGTASFSGPGRELLEDAMSRVDLDGERLIARLRDALTTLGPGGFGALAEEVERTALPVRVRAELDALALRSALRTGDLEAGREVLSRAPCDSSFLVHLDDPGRHLLEAARLFALQDGDATQADALLARFFLDFPTHPAREEAVEELERLVPRLPLHRRSEGLAQVLRERGPTGVPTQAIVAHVEALLTDHRPGAARRFLLALGDRAHDEALDEVRAQVDEAEADPPFTARDVHRARVAAWVDRPSASTRADVADGGAVAAHALADRLPPSPGPERRAAVELMLDAAGGARAVTLLAPEWSGAVDRFAPDVEALAAATGYGDLRRTVEALYPAVRTDARAAAEWERVCLGLDPVRLAGDDTLLARLHSPDFGVRRAAFEEVTTGSAPVHTPLLLAHFARDPAVLLRRAAVRTAASAGLVPIVVEGLRDPSYVVRQTACAGLADMGAVDAADELLDVLRRPDPEERVLGAAAAALVRLAVDAPRLVRPVTSIVRMGEPALADGVAARLSDLDRKAVAAGLAEQLRIEGAGPSARRDRSALFRLFSAHARAVGQPSGYDSSLGLQEVERLVLALPR